MAEYAADFDPAVVCPGRAGQVVAQAAAIEKMAATVKSLAAAWMAKGHDGRAEGSRSPSHELARRTGTSLGAARQSIEVGQRLAHQPLVDAAARRGELSPSQAALVSDAVEADPTAEAKLVAVAGLGSLAELRERCAQVKANAEPDLEARRRRIHSLRHLRTYTDPEGIWHLRAQGNPEHGAQVMSAIGPIADQIFGEARAEGRREPPDAYAFDALVRLANSAGMAGAAGPRAEAGTGRAGEGGAGEGGAGEGGAGEGGAGEGGAGEGGAGEGTGAGGAQGGVGEGAINSDADEASDGDPSSSPAAADPSPSPAGGGATGAHRPRSSGPSRTKVIVRIDFDALLRGYPVSGETCELVGYGPVAVSAVRDLLDTADPFIAAVVTKGQALVGVAHLGRRPNAYQQSALEWLYPSCAVQGCPAQARLEFDHRLDWATTHYTVFELLDRLCPHHHDLKTRANWSLVEGRGKRAFVGPDDPRHPRHPGRDRPPPPEEPQPPPSKKSPVSHSHAPPEAPRVVSPEPNPEPLANAAPVEVRA